MSDYSVRFYSSNGRPAVCYMSGTTVFEECLCEGGRMAGLYWSATGQVQRENVLCGIPQDRT